MKRPTKTGGSANSSASSASASVLGEKARYREDADGGRIKPTEECPYLKITRGQEKHANCVIIEFDSMFVMNLMAASIDNLVPFKYYGLGYPRGPDDRRYGRSGGTEILIDGSIKTDAKSGGRRRLQSPKSNAVSLAMRELFPESLGPNSIDPSCRLSDVLIVHKRRFADLVVAKMRLKNLDCRNTLAVPSLYGLGQKLKPEIVLRSYPLLCIYAKNEKFKKNGYPRLFQVVFTGLLNKNLMAANFPIEVVAREGFGSCIPSTADVGDGIRLDPGLLPPSCIPVVCTTLTMLDDFLADDELTSAQILRLQNALSGFGEEQLKLIDHLLMALTKTELLQKNWQKSVFSALKSPGKAAGVLPKRFEKSKNYDPCNSFRIEVCDLPPIPLYHPREKLDTLKERSGTDGYGSDSEGEFEGLQPQGNAKFVIRKAAFVSGMATLNIVSALSTRYCVEKLKDKAATKTAKVTAGYFEAADAGLGDHPMICHFNAAPNPTNALDFGRLPKFGEFLITTIDTTNITTAEKCEFINGHIMACQGGNFVDHLLILVESASKHPTGGDLIYGVVRLIGGKDAVDHFYDSLKDELEADTAYTSVLLENEHELRQQMLDSHLVARDRDFLALVNDKSHVKK